jgi:hypothetical protein
VQPHRCRARAAVEAESDGPLASVADIILGVGNVKNAGLGRPVFELQKNRAGRGGVPDFLSADFERMLGLNDLLFGNRRLLFFFWLFCWFFCLWRWLLGQTEIRSKKSNCGKT